ncbi:MAG: Nif3-like dinuclear metal center hexameric protein [Thermoleophilia bacterium]|jgi:dinuclear metal center YbgI/SA1388 family protein
MFIADLEGVLDSLAPWSLAESWDNVGLQVGDRGAAVRRILIALDLTPQVLDEAVAGAFDTIVTHHPVFFTPVSTLVDSRPRERLLRRVVMAGINVFACHTNLDAAPGGLADVASEALGLRGVKPLQPASAGWYKLVGFVPPESIELVAAAVFAAGAGVIGAYSGCAFALHGQGWFTPGPGSSPTIGHLQVPERTGEVRWETVVPRARLSAVMQAYVDAHPYDEPAFDIYPVDDVLTHAGLGRVGELACSESVKTFAGRIAGWLGLPSVAWSGDGDRQVRRVAVVPGSGRSLIDKAAQRADVLVTGDVGYHDAQRAEEAGLTLIAAPHEDLEWQALSLWSSALSESLAGVGVEVMLSSRWCSPWGRGEGSTMMPAASSSVAAVPCGAVPDFAATPPDSAATPPDGRARTRARLRVDGGARGNPGPGAIGLVLESEDGTPLEKIGRAIGVTTNNVAEYRALLAGLDVAKQHEIVDLEVFSDSELLVKQIRGDYQVKSEKLRPLYDELVVRLRDFQHVTINHVGRSENTEADNLVNQALDEIEAGRDSGVEPGSSCP